MSKKTYVVSHSHSITFFVASFLFALLFLTGQILGVFEPSFEGVTVRFLTSNLVVIFFFLLATLFVLNELSKSRVIYEVSNVGIVYLYRKSLFGEKVKYQVLWSKILEISTVRRSKGHWLQVRLKNLDGVPMPSRGYRVGYDTSLLFPPPLRFKNQNLEIFKLVDMPSSVLLIE
jgi:hypothetical protein